jgi:hypothetical protein
MDMKSERRQHPRHRLRRTIKRRALVIELSAGTYEYANVSVRKYTTFDGSRWFIIATILKKVQ